MQRYSLLRKRYFKDGYRVDNDQLMRNVKFFKEIAEKVQYTRRMPKNAHPVYKSYLTTVVKNGTPLKPKMITAAAKDKQFKAYEQGVADDFQFPNSTDIHIIQNLESVASYVIKYCTKKPTELPIGHNQVVRYDEDMRKNVIYTYDHVLNEQTGEYEEIEVDWDIYKPEFEERRINGRLWGCSDILRGMKLDEGQKVIEGDNGEKYVYEPAEGQAEIPYKSLTDDDVDPDLPEIPMAKRKFYTMKYFTKVYSESMVIAPASRDQMPIYSDSVVVDENTEKYLALLTDHIGKETIDSISKRVGESFERMQGRIIPLQAEKLGFKPKREGKLPIVKHADILKKFAPELHKEYTDYHTHIFNCIYKQAA